MPGHWEGGLIPGLRRSASGHAGGAHHAARVLPHLPPDEAARTERARTATGMRGAVRGHGAEAECRAIAAAIATLPAQLRRSLTWDQGTEMARHDELRIAHGLPVCIGRPQQPLAARRPTRTTRGLLRRPFPKGTDLMLHGPDEPEAVAAALDGRPRKTLGWRTPAEALDAQLLAAQGALSRRPVETALRALIAVVDDVLGPALAHGHLEGVEHQRGREVVGHRPPREPQAPPRRRPTRHPAGLRAGRRRPPRHPHAGLGPRRRARHAPGPRPRTRGRGWEVVSLVLVWGSG